MDKEYLCYMCGSSCDFHSQICDLCKRSPPSPPWFCDNSIDDDKNNIDDENKS